MLRRFVATPLLLTAALTCLPTVGSGQLRRAPAAAQGWPAIEIGVHGGYEYRSRGSLLGAQMRIPLHRSGLVELVPNGDVVFVPRLKEYMAGADLVVVSGGRQGGLYAGGGVTWRNALFDGTRVTKRVPTIVAGARSPGLFGSPLGTQIEIRWIRVDSPVKPKLLSFGINFPLWGRGEQRRR